MRPLQVLCQHAALASLVPGSVALFCSQLTTISAHPWITTGITTGITWDLCRSAMRADSQNTLIFLWIGVCREPKL